MTRAMWSLVVALSLASFGCSDPFDCEVTERRVAHDEVTSLGLAPDDLAEKQQLEGEMGLHWHDRDGPIELAPAGTDTILRWALRPAYDEAVYSEGDREVDGANFEKCAARLILPGRLELRTEDGWLDEPGLPVEITVYGSAPVFVSVEAPNFEIPIHTLSGALAQGTEPTAGVTLSVRLFQDGGGANPEVYLQLGGVLDENELTGDASFACAPAVAGQCRS